MSTQKIQLPDKLDFLLGKQARYKVIKGGRASAKSWSVARALLVRGIDRPQRALCGRELQKSIKDSVHQLLSDQITQLGLNWFYDIKSAEIVGKRGTSFGFAGLRHNITELKSYEGADIAWIEEAQVVSKKSWDILTPTIRKEESEIWVTFNPELEEDETYKRFVLHPPDNSIVVDMNWRDNPWFPEVLRQEMMEKQKRDPDGYLHVWEGHCKAVLEDAIYADELRKAKQENRITDVPYDPTKPVHTFWDLGWNNITGRTAVVMAQTINGQYRVIDYHEDAEHTVNWHIAELQKRSYVWGTDYLPHDAESTNLAASGKTINKLFKELGRKTKVLKRRPIGEGHNAVRTVFGQCYIDKTKCADLLQCLNRYRWEIDEDTGLRSKTPEDSIYKHGADSFRTFGMSIKEDKEPVKSENKSQHNYSGPAAWMS